MVTRPDMGDTPTVTDAPADTAPTDPPTPAPTAADMAAKDAEIEKWKGLSRKHEDAKKDALGQVKALQESQRSEMTDLERAIAEAKDEGLRAGRAEASAKLAAAAFRTAAKGTALEVDDDFLGRIDLAKFVGDDGDVDAEAIEAWVGRIAPATPEDTPADPPGPLMIDLGQGNRNAGDKPMALNGDPLTEAVAAAVGAPSPS